MLLTKTLHGSTSSCSLGHLESFPHIILAQWTSDSVILSPKKGGQKQKLFGFHCTLDDGTLAPLEKFGIYSFAKTLYDGNSHEVLFSLFLLFNFFHSFAIKDWFWICDGKLSPPSSPLKCNSKFSCFIFLFFFIEILNEK